VRSWSRALLLALVVGACARQFTSVGKTGYTPRWRVGDWWMVKTWEPATSGLADDSSWSYRRHDVAGVEKVGNQDCYVLHTGRQGCNGATLSSDVVWYVRKDNWLIAVGHKKK